MVYLFPMWEELNYIILLPSLCPLAQYHWCVMRN